VTLQPAGIILALITFGTIAAGHVLVRRLHARYGVRPALPLFALGALILISSLVARSNLLSAALGLTGVTIVWDGIEMYRQEKRMR
jgi:hypothetical protein